MLNAGSSRYTSSPTANLPRKTHRRRQSAVKSSKSSNDTTSTLPEYQPSIAVSSPGGTNLDRRRAARRGAGPGHRKETWKAQRGMEEQMALEEEEADLPPSYPDSGADEADEETDNDGRLMRRGHPFQHIAVSHEVYHAHSGSRSTPSLVGPAASTGLPRFNSNSMDYSYTQPLSARSSRRGEPVYRNQRLAGSVDGLPYAPSSSRYQHQPQRSHSHRTQPSRQSGSRHYVESSVEEDDDEGGGDQDDFLDALLKRSVQALEMSNVLMQTSMSTRDSVDAMNRGSRNSSPGPSRSQSSRYSPLPQSSRYSPVPQSSRHTPPPQSSRRTPPPPSSRYSSSPQQNPHSRVQRQHHRPGPSYERAGDYDYGHARRPRPRQGSLQDGYDVEDLESRARGFSASLRASNPVWQDDLDEIKQTLDAWRSSPTEEDAPHSFTSHATEGSISSSLPMTSSLPPSRASGRRRRSSLDLRSAASSGVDGGADEDSPQLKLSYRGRDQLISPPPRALTQYISNDPDEIMLPSTLGLRTSSHSWKTGSTANVDLQELSSHLSLLSVMSSTSTSAPASALPITPTAHDILSSFAPQPSNPVSPLTSPRLSALTRPFKRRGSSSGPKNSGVERPPADRSHISSMSSGPGLRSPRGRGSAPSSPSDSPRRSPSSSTRSHSRNFQQLTVQTPASSFAAQQAHITHNIITDSSSGSYWQTSLSSSPSSNSTISTFALPAGSRPLTIPPPIQELSSPSPTPSSDSDGCTAKLTISALRKILDEQPPASTSTLSASKLKAPQFMPGGRKNERGMSGFSEPRVSTATASVSRLLTKGTHSMTTRPPSPPKSSVLKKRDGNGTPISITGSSLTPVELATPAGGSNNLKLLGAATNGVENPSADSLTIASTMTSEPEPEPILSEAVVAAAVADAPSKFRLAALSIASLHLPSFGRSNASLSFSSPIQGTSHSNPGSGASTPKRISFAEPPEGTANPRSSRSRSTRRRSSQRAEYGHQRKRSSSLSSGLPTSRTAEEEVLDDMPWWTKWLFTAAGVSSSTGPGAHGPGGYGQPPGHSGLGPEERGGGRWGANPRMDDWGF